MTKEQLGSLILDSERQLYSTAKTILFSDYDCADAIQETIVKAFSNVGTLKTITMPGLVNPYLNQRMLQSCA